MDRARLVRLLADDFLAVSRDHPVRVGIDGPDASGKTSLADDLYREIEGRECRCIRASIDGFHHPRARRTRRGDLSPDGYYVDAFDHEALVRNLLRPLGPGGDGRYRRHVFDHQRDLPDEDEYHQASDDAVLVFNGVFLHRPELAPYWDYSVFLSVEPRTTLDRALTRDVGSLGRPDEVRRRYTRGTFPPSSDTWMRYARICSRMSSSPTTTSTHQS
jgi:uridine kinase